jgi:hypothetical protein
VYCHLAVIVSFDPAIGLHDLQQTLNPSSIDIVKLIIIHKIYSLRQWPPVKGVRPETATPTSDQWSSSSPDLLETGRESAGKKPHQLHQRLDLGHDSTKLPKFPMPKSQE